MSKQHSKRNTNLPCEIADPVLGELRFSAALDGMDEYETCVKLAGCPVFLDLHTDVNGSLTPCIKRAQNVVLKFDAINNKIRRYVERELFDSYNETWKPDRTLNNLDEMLGLLKLERVTTHPTPNVTFWFSAGDLFHGHALLIRMAERNKIVGHDMPG